MYKMLISIKDAAKILSLCKIRKKFINSQFVWVSKTIVCNTLTYNPTIIHWFPFCLFLLSRSQTREEIPHLIEQRTLVEIWLRTACGRSPSTRLHFTSVRHRTRWHVNCPNIWRTLVVLKFTCYLSGLFWRTRVKEYCSIDNRI